MSLRGTLISDFSATHFADAIKTNTTLMYLDLGENDIGDTGSVALADAFGINSTMTSFLFGGNRNSKIGEKAFASALETNSTLTSLKLDIGSESERRTIFNRLAVNKDAKALAAPAAEAFSTLPTSWECKLPVEVGALIVKAIIGLRSGKGNGVEGLRSLVIASDIVKQRNRDETS